MKWYVNPESNELVYGRKLAVNEILERSDVLAERGKWVPTMKMGFRVGWDNPCFDEAFVYVRPQKTKTSHV